VAAAAGCGRKRGTRGRHLTLSRWMVLARSLIAAAALLSVLSAAASAQSDGSDVDAAVAAGPRLDCNFVGIRVLIDDVNRARLVCRVTGAPSSDTAFSVSVIPLTGEGVAPRPLCSNGWLNAGAGVCVGGLVNPAIPLNVSARLQPSDATLGPVLVGAASAQPATEPMQFFPPGD